MSAKPASPSNPVAADAKAAKPKAAKPKAAKPKAAKSSVAKAKVAKPRISKPKTAKVGAGQPGGAKGTPAQSLAARLSAEKLMSVLIGPHLSEKSSGLAERLKQFVFKVVDAIDDIAKVFSGAVTDWSQLGFAAGKINVYAMVESSGVWGSFEDLVMKPRNLKARPDIIRIDASTDWSDKVAQDKSGIGITNIGIVRNSKALNVEASCGLIVRPSNFAAKTEEYPLMHRLHLYTSGTPKVPLARELLTFAMSPAMQPVLKEANFVDQSLEALDFQAQTARIAYALNAQTEDFDINMMRTMIGEVKGASRLSTTFRFGTADATLDSRANADIQRLAELLKSADYRNKPVMIIGFADAIGSFASNLKLSERRAAAVLRALTVSAGIGVRSQVTTRAYGELAPVACNDTPEARNYNRRVEVWVKN